MRPVLARPASLLLIVAVSGAFVCACGPKTMQTRLKDSEARAGQADDALTKAEHSLAALDPDEAQTQLDRADKLLSNPDAPLYPEYELMRSRLDEARAAVPNVRTAKLVNRAKTKSSAAADKARARSDAVLSTKVNEDAIRQGKLALDELRAALADGKEAEAKDATYQAWAREQRTWADTFDSQLKVASAKLEFIAGPLAAANEAAEKVRVAKKTGPVDERRVHYVAARDKFQECIDKGKALVTRTPALASAAVSSDGAVASIEGVLSDCAAGVKTAEKSISLLPKPKPAPPPKTTPTPKKKKKK